jgi:(E)-4-hydroxy-3-methylbut-2-enyl-diphosphate synthase
VYTSKEIVIGTIPLGGRLPVRIQSMTNTITADTPSSIEQCIRILKAGADYVRLTVRNMSEARNLRHIKEGLRERGFTKPLIADVHFNPAIANIAAAIVEKVRINPGNFSKDNPRESLVPLIRICKEHNTVLRIGVNHGSLSEKILQEYGNSEEGMVASAIEYLKICREEQFTDLVVSMKSSSTFTMIRSNRLLIKRLQEEGMDPAIHLGVTEAGEGEDGRIKSAIGIGTLLCEGIGDTIRVSLTEEPEYEIPAAQMILRASGTAENPPQKPVPAVSPATFNVNSFLPVGNNITPIVVNNYNGARKGTTLEISDPNPDILFSGNIPEVNDLKKHGMFIVPYKVWTAGTPFDHNICPVYTFDEFRTAGTFSDRLNFITLAPGEFDPEHVSLITPADKTVIVLECDEAFSNIVYRSAYHAQVNSGLRFPVIIKINYDIPDKDYFLIKAAVDTGGLFVDRICEGIWLNNKFFDERFLRDTAFNILQSSGTRIVKTEYIACPSCGRTLFNISKTLADIKAKTSHLKHLKIAVMGCIVNGPGEMADADYGYVGSGKGKVTLFRGREPVSKNIPEEDAVAEMIRLIKSDGRWI